MKDTWRVADLNDVSFKDAAKSPQQSSLEVYFQPESIDYSTQWITNLSRTEEEVDRTGMISFDAVNSPEKILKNSTLELMLELKNKIIKVASVFNSAKAGASSPIKVYGITQTEADFMIFRNTLKLIFSVQRYGTIKVSFNSHTGGFFTSPNVVPSVNAEHTGDIIQAQLGPFEETVWTYQGRKISIDQMIRFYMTKFIQSSIR